MMPPLAMPTALADLGETYWRLAEPAWLWLLFFLPVLAWLRGRRGPAGAIRFPSLALIRLATKTPPGRPGRWVFTIRLFSLAALILALARPQLGSGTQEVETSGIDIVLAIDLSGSMWAHDFELHGRPVDRLTAVKEVVAGFIRKRPNDRLGLVVFATEPFLVSPLTLNHSWLLNNLDRLRIGLIDPNRTAIGSALLMSANRLRDQPAKSKLIILLTDGENNSGTIGPVAAAEAAAAYGLRVHTIAAGREGIIPMPRLDENGQPLLGRDGRPLLFRQQSNLDTTTLNKVAELTNGRSWRATDLDELQQIYRDIDRLEKSEIKMKYRAHFEDRFGWPLAAGLLLLALEQALTQGRYRRLP